MNEQGRAAPIAIFHSMFWLRPSSSRGGSLRSAVVRCVPDLYGGRDAA